MKFLKSKKAKQVMFIGGVSLLALFALNTAANRLGSRVPLLDTARNKVFEGA